MSMYEKRPRTFMRILAMSARQEVLVVWPDQDPQLEEFWALPRRTVSVYRPDRAAECLMDYLGMDFARERFSLLLYVREDLNQVYLVGIELTDDECAHLPKHTVRGNPLRLTPISELVTEQSRLLKRDRKLLEQAARALANPGRE